MSERVPASPELNQKNSDTLRFLTENQLEIAPILENTEEQERLVDVVGKKTLSQSDTEFVDSVLERFETKIYEFDREDASPDAKRVLVTSANPGSFRTIKPIIEALSSDERIAGITALVSGVAGKDFEKTFPSFARHREQKTLLADLLSVANEREIDIALASVSVQNGPEKPILYGAKGNLGAKKTFLILDSWGLMKSTYAPEKMAEMEHIDGIFCNDEFAASIVKEALPEYAPEDIHAYGTPGLEQLEVEKAAAYRQETREKLGIDPDAFTILYGGDVSADYTDLDVPADINVETFEKTRSAVAAFANAHPERKVAVVVRPHPRARGTKDFDVLIRPTEAESPVENVLYKNGSNPISINEASYAADVIVSIVSTENLFAPARGRRSIFLAYKGLGDEVLNDMYGVTASDAIEAVPGVKKVSSEEELVRVFEQMAAEPPLEPQKSEDATKEILNTMLAD